MSNNHHNRDRRDHDRYAPARTAILLACALAPPVYAVLPQFTTACFHRFDRQTPAPTHPYYMPDMSAPRGHLALVADSGLAIMSRPISGPPRGGAGTVF